MRRINRERILSVEALPFDRDCIKCGMPSELYMRYKTYLNNGTVPICYDCYREFLKGEINI